MGLATCKISLQKVALVLKISNSARSHTCHQIPTEDLHKPQAMGKDLPWILVPGWISLQEKTLLRAVTSRKIALKTILCKAYWILIWLTDLLKCVSLNMCLCIHLCIHFPFLKSLQRFFLTNLSPLKSCVTPHEWQQKLITAHCTLLKQLLTLFRREVWVLRNLIIRKPLGAFWFKACSCTNPSFTSRKCSKTETSECTRQ